VLLDVVGWLTITISAVKVPIAKRAAISRHKHGQLKNILKIATTVMNDVLYFFIVFETV
jgi:hypothetical protein